MKDITEQTAQSPYKVVHGGCLFYWNGRAEGCFFVLVCFGMMFVSETFLFVLEGCFILLLF